MIDWSELTGNKNLFDCSLKLCFLCFNGPEKQPKNYPNLKSQKNILTIIIEKISSRHFSISSILYWFEISRHFKQIQLHWLKIDNFLNGIGTNDVEILAKIKHFNRYQQTQKSYICLIFSEFFFYNKNFSFWWAFQNNLKNIWWENSTK